MNIVVIMVEIRIGKPLICLSSQKSLTRRQLNIFQPIQLTENNFRYRYRCPDMKLIYRFLNDEILFHVTKPYHMTLTLVKESVKAIRHLVSGGANPNSQNSHGLTPSDLVNSNKYINQETQKRNEDGLPKLQDRPVRGPLESLRALTRNGRVMNGSTGERIMVPQQLFIANNIGYLRMNRVKTLFQNFQFHIKDFLQRLLQSQK